jgi:N-acyl-L-homoserine lactone synthetase
MHNITFDFLGQHRYGTAFHEYLRLRKSCFVDALGWDIPHNEDVEMDQYDNPCAHYSLVVHGGQVVGGARVMPTTATWGRHTYMLRDALRGCIEEIPASMLESDIATDEVWECTRLVSADSLTHQSERAACLSLVIGGVVDVVRRNGGNEIVSLTRPPLLRALRQLGFPVSQHGQPYVNRSDGLKYAVLRMPAVRFTHLIAAE